MKTILCIETGTGVCSVALSRGGRLVALRESAGERDHARNVAVYTDELLKENGLQARQLSAVAVAQGPGSYTGLRIGVSFAKGLCYSLGLPLIAVGSLESLARVAAEEYEAGVFNADRWEDTLLCPMVDARRMEVYMQVFDTRLKPLTDVSAQVITADSLAKERASGRPVIVFGDGAAKAAEVLPGVRLVKAVASARGLCAVAEEKLRAGLTEDAAYFEPLYLKDFVVTTSKKQLL
jgi:tRNA threonylcarbamoyladenosine biosynthesis protein TsaB